MTATKVPKVWLICFALSHSLHLLIIIDDLITTTINIIIMMSHLIPSQKAKSKCAYVCVLYMITGHCDFCSRPTRSHT